MDNVMKVAAIISRARHEYTSNISVAEEILVALGLQKRTTKESLRQAIARLAESNEDEHEV